VLFPAGGSRLDPAARKALDEIAERALPGAGEVWITGHSDLTEEHPGNLRLSEERAQVVEGYLAGLGVKAFRVEGRGAAEPLPALEGQDGRGERGNRRADVWLFPRR
jgi:outer membrane protein OmpA-like peptidoglycan-associated protein